jgi:predicted DNA-binding transcriptional regulator AlpA
MRQQLVFSRLRAPEAATYLGLSQSTLAKMRIRGDGPAYHKVGPRVVAYSVEDLDSWLKAGRRLSTSNSAAA